MRANFISQHIDLIYKVWLFFVKAGNRHVKGALKMGFFDNLFKKPGISVCAPLQGKCVKLSEVSDPTFGEGIIGPGVAIRPESGEVYAPADGVVSTLFPTGHAIAITTTDGAEVLIHIGLDTVKLNGTHFDIKVAQDQEVKKGDLLVVADIEKIREEGYDIITPVIICNGTDYTEVLPQTDKSVNPGDEIVILKK